MSQVFPFPCIGDQMSLAFQEFYKRDRSTGKVTGFPLQLYMHAQIKKQPLPAVREEVPGLLTLNKFRSRCERGRFTLTDAAPTRSCYPYNGLRRGLASNYFRGRAEAIHEILP